MNMYTFDREELEKAFTAAMSATVKAMQDEGIITREVADNFEECFSAIILTRKSLPDRIAETLFGEKKDTMRIKVIRLFNKSKT